MLLHWIKIINLEAKTALKEGMRQLLIVTFVTIVIVCCMYVIDIFIFTANILLILQLLSLLKLLLFLFIYLLTWRLMTVMFGLVILSLVPLKKKSHKKLFYFFISILVFFIYCIFHWALKLNLFLNETNCLSVSGLTH